ncbi:hypothetical protein HYH03_018696 [Edaphochlamys debaryana]|uniref:SRCR domain-containing protein n=1 Tax=Edaphochlamys debaryana TaxID=47281 RepID=A0A835XHD1_9CHLO|nr:hypothetical protein HYH03_018696 [Edaphochlamys debaryana]|eukprot:KAG2482376.1 hypothetical protein HYH03_018696 [Edaphochlamys debaryana]
MVLVASAAVGEESNVPPPLEIGAAPPPGHSGGGSGTWPVNEIATGFVQAYVLANGQWQPTYEAGVLSYPWAYDRTPSRYDWLLICTNAEASDGWSDVAAMLACRDSGFDNGQAVRNVPFSSQLRAANVGLYLRNVTCTAGASTWADCVATLENGQCTQLAALRCYAEDCAKGPSYAWDEGLNPDGPDGTKTCASNCMWV